MITNFDASTDNFHLKIIRKFHKFCFLLWKLKPNNTFKILMSPCKKYQTYDHNFWCANKGYLHEKTYLRFTTIDIFLRDLCTKQTFRPTDTQTLKCRIAIKTTTISPEQNLSNK